MMFVCHRKELTEKGEEENLYRDVDGIRLVYRTVGHGLEMVGWYRPDGWGKPAPVENGYAVMAGRMLE